MIVFYWSFYTNCGVCGAIWFSSSGIVQTNLVYRYWNKVFDLQLDHAITSFNMSIVARMMARMAPDFSRGSSTIS